MLPVITMLYNTCTYDSRHCFRIAVTIIQPELRTAEWGVDPGKSNYCSRAFHRIIALPARPVLNSMSIILLALKRLMVSLKESHYVHIKKCFYESDVSRVQYILT